VSLDLLLAALGTPHLDGAACRGRWNIFDQSSEPRAEQLALSLCHECPALVDCRRWIDSLPRAMRPTGVVAGRVVVGQRPSGVVVGQAVGQAVSPAAQRQRTMPRKEAAAGAPLNARENSAQINAERRTPVPGIGSSGEPGTMVCHSPIP